MKVCFAKMASLTLAEAPAPPFAAKPPISTLDAFSGTKRNKIAVSVGGVGLTICRGFSRLPAGE